MGDSGIGITELLILLPFLAILIWALVDVIRRPQEKMRYLPKWAWVLIVLFGNTIGQIVYLIVGRDNSVPVAAAAGSSESKARDAADALYGSQKGPE